MSSRDAEGVLFAADERGRRSTMPTNRAVWADAARAVDRALSGRIDASARWRAEYLGHTRAVTELGARSADAAQRVAAAGLAAARTRLVFRRDGIDHPLADATALAPTSPFASECIDGTGRPERELVVPYRGERLRGDALRRRIEA